MCPVHTKPLGPRLRGDDDFQDLRSSAAAIDGRRAFVQDLARFRCRNTCSLRDTPIQSKPREEFNEYHCPCSPVGCRLT
jgi:hypothetical protein